MISSTIIFKPQTNLFQIIYPHYSNMSLTSTPTSHPTSKINKRKRISKAANITDSKCDSEDSEVSGISGIPENNIEVISQPKRGKKGLFGSIADTLSSLTPIDKLKSDLFYFMSAFIYAKSRRSFAVPTNIQYSSFPALCEIGHLLCPVCLCQNKWVYDTVFRNTIQTNHELYRAEYEKQLNVYIQHIFSCFQENRQASFYTGILEPQLSKFISDHHHLLTVQIPQSSGELHTELQDLVLQMWFAASSASIKIQEFTPEQKAKMKKTMELRTKIGFQSFIGIKQSKLIETFNTSETSEIIDSEELLSSLCVEF